MTDRSGLAVIVPTLDEAHRLPTLLRDLAALRGEIVVSDGGSSDGTREIAFAPGVRLIDAPRGRASQLRAGAADTSARWLFFLHADSRLSPEALEALHTFVEGAGEDDFAHFGFRLDGDHLFYRFIEFGQRLRQRSTGLVYGDQGLIVSRSLYERVGGYPEWPILEDVGLFDRLRRAGREHALEQVLSTSPRRYEAEGHWRGWIRNVAIIALHRLGTPPEAIAKRFARLDDRPKTTRGCERAVIVFAKAPRPGRVKTRLAADIGAEEATRIYRELGRATVEALRRADARLIVYHDPPDARARSDVESWLGADGVEFRPQRGHDLGERMSNALGECLAEAERVCIVGTDIPGIDADTVATAYRLLDESDVVIGPATDGGYYLLALSRPMPDLFRDIEWSTNSVLEKTLARADERNVTVALMDFKTDVDTARDIPPELQSA